MDGPPRNIPAQAQPTSTGHPFNDWLRAQLRSQALSQRALALQSGVAQSTISRLVEGKALPSLGVATRLARGLRESRPSANDSELVRLIGGTQNPTAHVEYAIRADDALVEPQVRQIMEYYLAVRMRGAHPRGTPSIPLDVSVFAKLPTHVARVLRSESIPARRRQLIDVFGVERYVPSVGEVIDTDLDGAGRARRLWRAPRPGDTDIVMVEVANATAGPDGEFEHHWLRVPPTTTTCQTAVAWTFGVDADDYRELVET